MNNVEKRLTTLCKPGERVWWRTLDGTTYSGVLKEFDNGTAIIVMPDGREKAAKAE
jgi:small nuclear ribonucleoprotein (snRNP)-like protein